MRIDAHHHFWHYNTRDYGWISDEKMRQLAQPMIKNQYGQYLMRLIEN